MSAEQRILLTFAFVLVACAACSTSGETKPSEEGAPVDGKLDGFADAVDHGVYELGGGEATGQITAQDKFHSWTVNLSAPASLSIRTQTSVDTVLYLYRQQEGGGWGRYIRKNDDADGEASSRIDEDFDGDVTLRILVKGHDSDSLGRFGLVVDCDGEGCETRKPVAECPFSSDVTEGADSFDALYNNEVVGIHLTETESIDLNGTVSKKDQARITAAMALQYEDVKTFDAALEHISFFYVSRYDITTDTATYEAYTFPLTEAYDPVIGGIFEVGESEPLAQISEDFVICQ